MQCLVVNRKLTVSPLESGSDRTLSFSQPPHLPA